MQTSTGPRQRDPDPVTETCPLCWFEGAPIVVYRHLRADHLDVDPDDFFSDPIGDD